MCRGNQAKVNGADLKFVKIDGEVNRTNSLKTCWTPDPGSSMKVPYFIFFVYLLAF